MLNTPTPVPDNSTDFATIPDVSLDAIASRVAPRQVTSGVSRSTQTIMGSDTSRIDLGVVANSTELAIAQYDNTGTKVSQFGQQADGSSGLKFFDANGIGLAQFGTYADGTTALKVAEAGVEVGTATDSQLVFNSNQDFFKIVKTDTILIPGTGNQSPFATGATGLTVVHNLGYIPAFSAYVFVPVVAVAGQPPVSSWNQSFPAITSDANQMTYNLQCGTDAANIYFVDFWANNGNTAPVQAFSVTYYLFTRSIAV